MKKRIIPIFLALLVTVHMPISVLYASTTMVSPIEREMVRSLGTEFWSKMAAQSEAVWAFDTFCNALPRENGQLVFPSEFAGEYIIDGVLHVYLTDTSAEVVAKYDAYFGKYKDVVVYEKVKYSREYLNNIAKGAWEQIPIEQRNSYYVDTRNNCAVLTVVESVDEKSLQSKNDVMARCGMPIVYRTERSMMPSTTAFRGGDRIHTVGNASAYRTLSACGTYNGQPAIVTCGHLNGATITPIGHTFSLQEHTGIMATVVNSKLGAAGDYAIATVNANSYHTTPDSKATTGGYNSFSGGMGIPANGTYLVKYGVIGGFTGLTVYGSGSVTYKTMDAGGAVVESRNVNLFFAEVEVGVIRGGDSGGPVVRYEPSTGKYFYAGCHVSGNHVETNGVVTQEATSEGFTPYAWMSGFTVLDMYSEE